MSSKWELKEKSTGELVATVEGDVWKSAQKKAFNKIKKNINIPGFRKGQAPAALIKKQVPVQNILLDAVDEAVSYTHLDVYKRQAETACRPAFRRRKAAYCNRPRIDEKCRYHIDG